MDGGKRICCFCGREVGLGQEAMVLMKRSVCKECENALLTTAVEDSKYDEFKEKIKRMWFN